MIIDPPITELLEKTDCRYTLIVEVSKRARQLVAGAKPAVQEINRGGITYRREDEDQ